MKPRYPTPGSQTDRILQCLLNADGDWVNGQYFLRTMMLSQYHARIKELEDRFHWKIEHSTFKDDYGFVSYRIVQEKATLPLFNQAVSLPTKQVA